MDWTSVNHSNWQGQEGLPGSVTIGLPLDLDEGTLSMSAFDNGRRLGATKDGSGGEDCWFTVSGVPCTIGISIEVELLHVLRCASPTDDPWRSHANPQSSVPPPPIHVSRPTFETALDGETSSLVGLQNAPHRQAKGRAAGGAMRGGGGARTRTGGHGVASRVEEGRRGDELLAATDPASLGLGMINLM
ncbi:hypothetical protein THAOC_35009 [Thalassiosira oceanica]|uniref:Uncharacterized protein n=1 Tax=Thalassiosira oceanica TaxID=159749 RepID=K0RI80_THAOC|nr:hypothetical protein THAOC_35009 [Thalassiosira oceanica]|eukprot:EJK46327.1 hypothetical protein THAOC_35009 [Thalassiosira oceanica]